MRIYEFFIYITLFIIINFFVFSAAYDDYTIVNHLWYIDVKKNARSFKDLDFSIHPNFELNYHYYKNRLFYFNETGDLLHQLILEKNTLVSPTSSYYVIYNKIGDKVHLYRKNGVKIWELETHSYPNISYKGTLIAILSTDNTTVTLYDNNRNIIFEKSAISTLITDYKFCIFDESFCVGTMEGFIFYINYTGKISFKIKTPESKINFVKSVAIGNKGNYVAALSGLYPEYISVYNKKGILMWKKKTFLDRRKTVSIFVDEVNRRVYEQTMLGIRAYRLRDGKLLFNINIDDFPFEKISYIKADYIKGKVLFAFTMPSDTFSILINRKGHIIWKKRLIDRYIINCEIEEQYGAFLIAGTSFVYCMYISEPILKNVK
ncbi:hypothetical protein ACFL6D_00150 [Spirochaetota bacterium]